MLEKLKKAKDKVFDWCSEHKDDIVLATIELVCVGAYGVFCFNIGDGYGALRILKKVACLVSDKKPEDYDDFYDVVKDYTFAETLINTLKDMLDKGTISKDQLKEYGIEYYEL